jgi:hypothetical protein
VIAYAVAITALTANPKPSRHSDYLRFVRRQPCLICAATYGVESAHTGGRGLGQKADDRFALPLCLHHHRTGPESHHKLGKRFWSFHGLDRVELIGQMQALFQQDRDLKGGSLQGSRGVVRSPAVENVSTRTSHPDPQPISIQQQKDPFK